MRVADATDVEEAFAAAYGYAAYAASGGTMTKRQFAQSRIDRFIFEVMEQYLVSQALAAARTTADSSWGTRRSTIEAWLAGQR